MRGTARRSHPRCATAATGVLLTVLLLLLSACSPADPTSSASESPESIRSVPAIPGVEEAAGSQDPAPASTVNPPSPQVRAGEHVLIALEGRVTNRDATDVVIRTERGVELDRFRLAGAIQAHAEPGGRWALVNTVAGQWAVLDGVSGTLTLMSFPGDAPTTVPQLSGPLAWWNDPATPWLARLDGGEPIDLTAVLGEPAQIQEVTTDGAFALAIGSRSHLIDTRSGDSRAGDQTSFVSLSPAGRLLTVLPSEGGGALLTTEQADGSERRELALLSRPGHPISLAGGAVLVAGEVSVVVDDAGGQRPVPPIRGIGGTPIVGPDGRLVVVPTLEGLALVDLEAATVVVVADTVGHTRPVGSGRWLWSVSGDPEASGALVIDTQTGSVTRLLSDTTTTEVGSVTSDGALAAVLTGAGGTDAVIVGVDGAVQPVVGDARVVDVALHPSGTFSAAALVVETTRLLLVREGIAQQAQIDTGRSPVWLRTTE